MRHTPGAVLLLAVAAILATILGETPAASAQTPTREFIVVPAVAFIVRGNVSVTYNEAQGALEVEDAAVVRAPIYLTKAGLNICRLSLWAHDNDGAFNVTANLVRKRVVADGSGFGEEPVTIASVSSNGGSVMLRAFHTTTISAPVVSTSHYYWVELVFGGGNLDATGVRVELGSTC
jgi:hypothetical protein